MSGPTASANEGQTCVYQAAGCFIWTDAFRDSSRLIIRNGPPGRAVKVVILTALERPEKSEQPCETEAERQRHQNDEHFHHGLRCATRRARSAFNITSSEEPDIASAAISGVTNPAMAIGTARKLYPTASQRFCRINP